MRLKDFNRLKALQRKKWTEVTVYVDDMSRAEPSPSGGLQQRFQLILGEGIDLTEMICYFDDDIFEIKKFETPNQKFKIMWIKKDDGGYWKCWPCLAEAPMEDDDYPDWDKIALGKCRHKHIDKLLERMMPTELIAKPKELEAINKLVEFEAKGTVVLYTED